MPATPTNPPHHMSASISFQRPTTAPQEVPPPVVRRSGTVAAPSAMMTSYERVEGLEAGATYNTVHLPQDSTFAMPARAHAQTPDEHVAEMYSTVRKKERRPHVPLRMPTTKCAHMSSHAMHFIITHAGRPSSPCRARMLTSVCCSRTWLLARTYFATRCSTSII